MALYNEVRCLNPVGEIVLTERKQVVPWVQVQMMQYLRVKTEQEPYTVEECLQILKELEEQYDS